MVLDDFKCGVLTFSSNFDSGNLAAVEEVDRSDYLDQEFNDYDLDAVDYEYNIWTSPDAAGTCNENGNRSWFYFSVRGQVTSKMVKFNIMNMNKQSKLYSQGFSPIYKTLPGKVNSWKRVKDKPTFEFIDGQFVLSFTHRFLDSTRYSSTYFAFCYPYSYEECQKDMKALEQKYCTEIYENNSDIYVHHDILCHSNDGLNVDLLTISSRKNILQIHEEKLPHLFPDKTRKRALQFKDKKVFFLTSRVHPGETPAAFVFNGFLNFILRSDDARAIVLRDLFVFKLVPMLNPDGVKRGHYRTDSFGVNLNRVYLNPDPKLHPSIYAIKELMVYHNGVTRARDTFSSLERAKGIPCRLKTSQSHPEININRRKSFSSTTRVKVMKKSQTEPTLSKLTKVTRQISSACLSTGRPSTTSYVSSSETSSNTESSSDVDNHRTDVNIEEGNIAMYIDLHGHASKRGCFMYGNYFEKEKQLIECMLFPKLIALNSSHFDFQACNFSEKNMYHKDRREGLSKEGSGRVAMFKRLGIIHSYTLECNYNSGRCTNPIAAATCDDGRATPPPLPGFPPKYTQAHYEEVGRGMAVAMLDLHQKNPWSRLPLSDHKSLSGVREWLMKFLRNSGKTVGLSNKKVVPFKFNQKPVVSKDAKCTPDTHHSTATSKPSVKITNINNNFEDVTRSPRLNFMKNKSTAMNKLVPLRRPNTVACKETFKFSLTNLDDDITDPKNVCLETTSRSINGKFKSPLIFLHKYSHPNVVKDLKERSPDKQNVPITLHQLVVNDLEKDDNDNLIKVEGKKTITPIGPRKTNSWKSPKRSTIHTRHSLSAKSQSKTNFQPSVGDNSLTRNRNKSREEKKKHNISGTTRKKVRPSTASGVIQSSKIQHVLDDVRPNTASPKIREVLNGLEPTYITAQQQIGRAFGSKYTGKQVHGGIDSRNLKDRNDRRATLGPTDNFHLFNENNQPKRPVTAVNSSRTIKIEERITLEHLNKMKQAFEEADEDASGTLDLEEFKNVFKYFLGIKGASEQQMTSLFMKIDSSSDGEINWDEFCTYMQLEYAEKEESYFRAKETSFYLPATVENSPHRDTVLRITHTSDNTFLSIGQDGVVSFWSAGLMFKRTKQLESGSKKSKWITDFILMPQYNKIIIGTGDREIQFHELSTFEGYCQISGLETVPLRLDYCFTSADDCLLLYGDSEGCVSIFVMKNVGEILRLWKKMPKVEGIASISIDSACVSENVKFVRWKVHNDWVQELKYYHSIRSVISCSTDSSHSLVIGQTLGSTHVSNSSRDMKKVNPMSFKDINLKRRLAADETVFRIYKGVKTFDFSKSKNVLATGGMDRLIRLWNPYVPTKPVGILRGHVTPIFYLFIVDEDNRLFSISNDKTVKVWDIHDQACLLTVRPKSHLIRGDLTAVHYNAMSRGLILATDQIALLRLKNKPLSMQMTTTHKEGVTCCCFNKSFKHVVTSSENSVVKVWDIESGNQVFEFSKVHDGTSITSMCFDNTERRLVTSGQDGKIKIWNYNNGHCLSTLEPEEGEAKEISSLIYFTVNKNRYIVSVGWDRRINLYSDDQNDLHHIRHPYIRWPDDIPGRAHKEDILCVSYTPPHFLATCSYDGEVLIWNVTSGRIFCRLQSEIGHTTQDEILTGKLSVSKLVFLRQRHTERNAASLVTNGPKGLIHFWNIFYSRNPYAAFNNDHGNIVSFLLTNEKNDLLISADCKGFMTVWDISSYCIHGETTEPPPIYSSWRAHIQEITCIDISETYKCLITSSVDYTVRCWTFDGHFIGTSQDVDVNNQRCTEKQYYLKMLTSKRSGTFGQPRQWDIYEHSTYQHPMAPYDVLMDPESIPQHTVFDTNKSNEENNDSGDAGLQEKGTFQDVDVKFQDILSQERQKARAEKMNTDLDIQAMIASTSSERVETTGKRLRHAKMKGTKIKNGHALWNGSSAYKSLQYYSLEEVPPLPDET